MYEAALADELEHFTVEPGAFDEAARAIADQVELSYPVGLIPIHGRLNHLRRPGFDGAAMVKEQCGNSVVDFVFVSVLLDAGAGAQWRFFDDDAGVTARSEGLAVASLRATEAGVFSASAAPYEIDGAGLANLDGGRVAELMQHRSGNEMAGFEGRVDLLRSLGTIVMRHEAPSVGAMLSDEIGGDQQITGSSLLRWILDRFSDLWPGRVVVDGCNLGDTWRHPSAGGKGNSAGLVPFHKLSQWLAYSLVEPLGMLGVNVTELGGLTGLAEYRNGGMMLETGAISLRSDPPDAPISPDDRLVVEWRALTVALLDEMVERVQSFLPVGRAGLGLGELLEAGTWPLGRRFAFDRSASGEPPIRIVSDGTVF